MVLSMYVNVPVEYFTVLYFAFFDAHIDCGGVIVVLPKAQIKYRIVFE